MRGLYSNWSGGGRRSREGAVVRALEAGPAGATATSTSARRARGYHTHLISYAHDDVLLAAVEGPRTYASDHSTF